MEYEGLTLNAALNNAVWCSNLDKSEFLFCYNSLDEKERSDLTRLLMKEGLKPLEFMSDVPAYFAEEMYELRTITIPSTIHSIGEAAFNSCEELQEVIIEGPLYTIQANAFCDCGVKHIKFPDTLKSIKSWAFYNCDLEELNLPASVKHIHRGAFCQLDNLERITFHPGIELMSTDAFHDCPKLSSVKYHGTVEQLMDEFGGSIHLFWDSPMLTHVECTNGKVKIPRIRM